MASRKEPVSTPIKLWIDWNGAAQKVPLQHTNQAVVQIVEHEVNLSFFLFSPPVLIASTAEEAATQMQGVESIVPDCLARINMSAVTAKGLIEALQKQFDEKGNLKGDGDEDSK